MGNLDYNDSVGDSDTDIEFVDILDERNGNVEIISEYDNHNAVLNYSNTDSSTNNFYNSLSSQNLGTVEFWASYGTGACQIQLDDSIDLAIVVRFYSDKIRVYHSTTNTEYSYDMSKLHHISIDFDVSTDTFSIDIDGENELTDVNFYNDNNVDEISRFYVKGESSSGSLLLDAIGYSWDTDYNIGDNLEYSEEENGFHYAYEFLDTDYNEIAEISNKNGTFYVNESSTEFNVFYNGSVYDTWIQTIDIDTSESNITLYVFNTSDTLLFNQSYTLNNTNYIKYIRYVQYYQNTSHYVYTSNLTIESNSTRIASERGFMSYNLEGVEEWDTTVNSQLTVEGYGYYRFWLCSGTYTYNTTTRYQLTSFTSLRDTEQTFDLSNLDYSVSNPYLVVETKNGAYLLDTIKINGSGTQWLLSDSRGYLYNGELSTSNAGESVFYVQNERLYFELDCNDTNTESITLTFDITNFAAEGYRFETNTQANYTLEESEIRIIYTDVSQDTYAINRFFNSITEILEQEKTVSQLEIHITDNDLYNNQTIQGYVSAITFDYREDLDIDIFNTTVFELITALLLIIVPTLALSHLLADKGEMFNKDAILPLFVIFSIVAFATGFLPIWILFLIIFGTIAYYYLSSRGGVF
jgi:hypothetical protein